MKISIFIILFINIIGMAQNNKTKMIGGIIVEPGQFPFVVALLNKTLTATCTGSLITWEKVLTAAHCIRKCLAGEMNGNILRDNNGKLVSGQARDVKNYVMHPEFETGGPPNDIAVITVVKNFQQSEIISLINLGTAAFKLNDPCIAIGYGTHEKEGDSGGPLINPDDLHNVLGVAYGRAADFSYSVYVNVIEHREWILQQIKEKGQKDEEGYSRREKSIGIRCEIKRVSISPLFWLLLLGYFQNY